jgi:putative ABC transport system substrate-binding protein
MTVGRRQFVQGVGVVGLGLLAGCGRLPGQSQAPSKVPRIGCLLAATAAAQAERLDAFRQGLADYGYVEGRDLVIEPRYADGALDRMPALAEELVALRVAVILTGATAFAQVVTRATSTIPVVVAGTGGDLVEDGLAASYARPGGNVTGLSVPRDVRGKSLQLLTEAAPSVANVAVLGDKLASRGQADYESFARRLGIRLQFIWADNPDELGDALGATAEERAEGLYVVSSPSAAIHRDTIIALAAKHRLPAMYGRRDYVEAGGLMAYDWNQLTVWRRAAYFVDRILKGASPADLPVEQPMTFDFVLNLKTAQALGLTIPEHVLLQATEVIQ